MSPPRSRAIMPAMRRASVCGTTEEMLLSAMTTSVNGRGDRLPHWTGRKTLPDRARCPSRMAGLLAHGSGRSPERLPHAAPVDLPGIVGDMKTGRFVDKEASAPWFIMSPRQWPSGAVPERTVLHHCQTVSPSPFRRHSPFRSTVAGSAAIEAPCVGPPFAFPLESSPSICRAGTTR